MSRRRPSSFGERPAAASLAVPRVFAVVCYANPHWPTKHRVAALQLRPPSGASRCHHGVCRAVLSASLALRYLPLLYQYASTHEMIARD